jgi:hypothetical protein
VQWLFADLYSRWCNTGDHSKRSFILHFYRIQKTTSFKLLQLEKVCYERVRVSFHFLEIKAFTFRLNRSFASEKASTRRSLLHSVGPNLVVTLDCTLTSPNRAAFASATRGWRRTSRKRSWTTRAGRTHPGQTLRQWPLHSSNDVASVTRYKLFTFSKKWRIFALEQSLISFYNVWSKAISKFSLKKVILTF